MLEPNSTVRLDFCDFGTRFVKPAHYFARLLARRHRVEIHCEPDLLIHGHEGDLHRLHRGTRLFYTPETIRPDFAETDFAVSQLDWGDPRNLRLPNYALWTDPEPLLKPPGEAAAVFAVKSKFACFFTSYAGARAARRIAFYEQLSQYRRVDSAGQALNNVGATVPFQLAPKLDFLRPYKFYLAFENESRRGYTTEKIIEAMLARCVPIYWGNPAIAEEFNPQSFINVHDFADDAAAIAHIRRVDQDDDLYREYLAQPFFPGGVPNEYFSRERVLAFLEGALAPPPPRRRHRGALPGRWTLARANKPHDPAADFKMDWRPGRQA